MTGDGRFEAVVFDLFGTLVPEFSRSDFYEAVRRMAEILGADAERFEAGWNASALERQTGGFATVDENVRSICASLGDEPSDEAVDRALDVRLGLYLRGSIPVSERSRRWPSSGLAAIRSV